MCPPPQQWEEPQKANNIPLCCRPCNRPQP